jgi:hypothetical protein
MGFDVSSGNDYLPVRLQLKVHNGKACISRHVHPSLETREGKASPGKRPDMLLKVGVGVSSGE